MSVPQQFVSTSLPLVSFPEGGQFSIAEMPARIPERVQIRPATTSNGELSFGLSDEPITTSLQMPQFQLEPSIPTPILQSIPQGAQQIPTNFPTLTLQTPQIPQIKRPQNISGVWWRVATDSSDVSCIRKSVYFTEMPNEMNEYRITSSCQYPQGQQLLISEITGDAILSGSDGGEMHLIIKTNSVTKMYQILFHNDLWMFFAYGSHIAIYHRYPKITVNTARDLVAFVNKLGYRGNDLRSNEDSIERRIINAQSPYTSGNENLI